MPSVRSALLSPALVLSSDTDALCTNACGKLRPGRATFDKLICVQGDGNDGVSIDNVLPRRVCQSATDIAIQEQLVCEHDRYVIIGVGIRIAACPAAEQDNVSHGARKSELNGVSKRNQPGDRIGWHDLSE
jgi:hypothetical protein